MKISKSENHAYSEWPKCFVVQREQHVWFNEWCKLSSRRGSAVSYCMWTDQSGSFEVGYYQFSRACQFMLNFISIINMIAWYVINYVDYIRFLVVLGSFDGLMGDFCFGLSTSKRWLVGACSACRECRWVYRAESCVCLCMSGNF